MRTTNVPPSSGRYSRLDAEGQNGHTVTLNHNPAEGVPSIPEQGMEHLYFL